MHSERNDMLPAAFRYVVLQSLVCNASGLIYLDHAWKARLSKRRPTPRDLYDAIMEGAVERVRPKMMTVTAIMGGLLPILWGSGAGGTIMRRIAAPMIGGMISSTALTLLVIPAIYALWKERELAADPILTGQEVPA